jgi:competence protein ComEA
MRAKLVRSVIAAALAFGSGYVLAGPVNINTADATTLAAELTGVGPALAAAIVADRQAHGSFASPEALTRVKGIGSRIVEMNKANILVGEPSPAPQR